MNAKLVDFIKTNNCFVCGKSATHNLSTNDGRSFELCDSKSCKAEMNYILEVRK